MERFGLEDILMDLDPRYNISPTQSVPVIIDNSGDDDEQPKPALAIAQWGLVPGFVKDPRLLKPMINARAETIMEKRIFKGAFLHRRCLIPADGFYEWLTENKKKRPVRFQLKDKSIFAFAGIYEEGKDLEGNPRRTCSIITTAANDTVAPVHDRMPVILRRDDESRWIDRDLENAEELLTFLKPLPNDAISFYRCSTVVNSARFDNAGCILEADTPEALAAEQEQAARQAELKAKGKKTKADGVQLQLNI